MTAVPNAKAAEALAEAVVSRRLGGCFQMLGPIRSVYRWRGKIEKAKEYLCLIKTRKSLYRRLERQIKKLHPYSVPEILAVAVSAGSRDYLTWLDRVTRL